METNCSEHDIMRVLNRSLVLLPYPDNTNSQIEVIQYVIIILKGVSVLVHKQIERGDLYNVSSYVSDAVRSLALALNSCLMNEVSWTSCKGTQLDWNITFTGNTVC